MDDYLIFPLNVFVILSKTLIAVGIVPFLCGFETVLCVTERFNKPFVPFMFELCRRTEVGLRNVCGDQEVWNDNIRIVVDGAVERSVPIVSQWHYLPIIKKATYAQTESVAILGR